MQGVVARLTKTSRVVENYLEIICLSIVTSPSKRRWPTVNMEIKWRRTLSHDNSTQSYSVARMNLLYFVWRHYFMTVQLKNKIFQEPTSSTQHWFWVCTFLNVDNVLFPQWKHNMIATLQFTSSQMAQSTFRVKMISQGLKSFFPCLVFFVAVFECDAK